MVYQPPGEGEDSPPLECGSKTVVEDRLQQCFTGGVIAVIAGRLDTLMTVSHSATTIHYKCGGGTLASELTASICARL